MSDETNTAVAEAPATETPATDAVVAEVKTKKKRGPNIPWNTFIEVYNSSNTRDEVLDKFHALGYSLSYGALISRASNYTDEGVQLKELDRKKSTGKKGKSLNVAEMNKLAAEVIAAAAIVKPAQGESTAQPTA